VELNADDVILSAEEWLMIIELIAAAKEVPDPEEDGRCPEPGCVLTLVNDRSRGYLLSHWQHNSNCWFGKLREVLILWEKKEIAQ